MWLLVRWNSLSTREYAPGIYASYRWIWSAIFSLWHSAQFSIVVANVTARHWNTADVLQFMN